MKLFEPGKIGRLTVKNRIVMASMGNTLSEPDGRILERAIDYYVERARGGVGMITIGAHKVENEIERELDPSTLKTAYWHPIVSLAAKARLYELAQAIHDYDAKISIQLTPGFGRVARGVLAHTLDPVGPSALPCFWNPKVMTRKLTIAEIEKFVQAFGRAAKIVAAAELDAIELHGHEGYIFDAFQTSIWNRRRDKYGGDLDNRLRFPLEVIACIKDSVGKDFPVIYRYGVKHYIDGGRDVPESLEIAKRLENAGVDALHVDAGCYDGAAYWAHPTTYQPYGCLVDMAEAVKKVVKIPVIAVGKLNIPALAEKTLQEGKADFIALGRPLLADPEWPIKAREGRLDEIRPCIGDHDGCFRPILEGKYISCTVNPACGNERNFKITPAQKPKSVLIVGGGVAGMEAARVAALRNHKVTLCEKSDQLGGLLIPGSVPQFKQDLRLLVDYLSTQIRKLGVEIQLKTEVTPKIVEKMNPNVVIIATGAKHIIPEIRGTDSEIIISAIDLLNSEKEVGQNVVIAGGGLVGCETAAYLAEKGKKVTIVEMLKDIALDVFYTNRQLLLKMLDDGDVNVLTEARLTEITDDGVVTMDRQGKSRKLNADTVVLALGLEPERKLLDALYGKVPELYVIGDCAEPRKIVDAMREGFRTAFLI